MKTVGFQSAVGVHYLPPAPMYRPYKIDLTYDEIQLLFDAVVNESREYGIAQKKKDGLESLMSRLLMMKQMLRTTELSFRQAVKKKPKP
jgi:hypothetical protein